MRTTFLYHSLIALFISLSNAQNATDTTLPQAVFDDESKVWFVTVSDAWNFTTILEATGNASFVREPEEALSRLQLPFPGFNVTSSTYFNGSNSRYLPLVYVNDTWSAYATNALAYALQQNLNTSIAAYSDETWKIPVTCEWPISGQYSRLNRVLYYVLLVFALVTHHHEWLVAGALASATIYSGSAAVQALAQFVVINMKSPKDSAGDNDNEAILGILAAGLLMAVPLINWSRTLRRLQARPIIIYWALIIFVGYLLVIIGMKQTEFSHGWSRKDGGMMTCATQENIPNFKDLGFIDRDFISKYNCDDPCYDPVKQHPLRDASAIVGRVDCTQFTWTKSSTVYSCFSQCPRSIADTCWIGHDGWTKQDFALNDAGYYGLLPVIIFELFFVLCFGRKSPEEIRETMFMFLVGSKTMGDHRAMEPEKRRRTPLMLRARLAQAGALIFYFFSACTYLVCLPFFVFSIIWQERLLRFFPDAESPYETSQWLPWVGVVLTLGAAIVGKYHHSWHVHMKQLFSFRQKNLTAPIGKAKRKGDTLTRWIRKRTWRTRSRLWVEWRDLKDFIARPFYLVLDETRERTSEHPTVKFSFAGDLAYPLNAERNDKNHYQGPWEHNDTWKDFPVIFQVEADDRTLKSWELYQDRHKTRADKVVYTVMLPAVPTHPDRRTITAPSNVHTERLSAVPVSSGDVEELPDVSQALVPNARKHSDISFKLSPESTLLLGDEDNGPSEAVPELSGVVAVDAIDQAKESTPVSSDRSSPADSRRSDTA